MKKRTLSLLLAVVCLFSLTAGLLSGCGGSKLQVSFDLNYDDAPEAPAAIQVKTGKTYGDLPVLCSSGVASNTLLRSKLEPMGTIFAPAQYSTDNALGVAILAHRCLERGAAQ